jgi:hypothetical protein
MMMMTSTTAQQEKLPRKVELARLTLILFRYAIVTTCRAFAWQSLPRRHPLLFL